MKLRRKRFPAELERPFSNFTRVVSIVERAKQALTEVMPTTRLPGRPPSDALSEFEEVLGEARVLMPGWRHAEIESEWSLADAGLSEALDRARRLREEAPDLGGFEDLIWVVGELLAPLEPFGSAAVRFRQLRTV